MARQPDLSINSILVHHDYRQLTFPLSRLIKTAADIYNKEHINEKKQTHLILCSDYRIKKLNATFRNKNKATDVLSFSYNDPDLLGEIYISLQRIEIQARRYKTTYNEECMRMFVHGMFHLLGYDHQTEKDRAKMEAKEMNYL